jgi:outer membrane protein assembly factor BamB
MRSIAIVALLPLLASPSLAENDVLDHWHQWRGPSADGTSPDGDPPTTWSETQNVAWKIEVPGEGNGSPIVWGEHLFLMSAVPTGETVEPPEAPAGGGFRHPAVSPPDKKHQFTILAIERASGEIAWSTVVREELPHEGTHIDGTFASASPVTDGERIYAHFGSRGIYALDMKGEVLWQKDLGDMVVRNGFGEGASPALAGDRLLVPWDHQGPSFLVALDRRTGDELWRVERDEITSWTTPLVVEHEGRQQVITSATQGVRSYDVATGELLWHGEGVTLNAIPSPVSSGDFVYVTSGFRGSVLRAIRLSRAQGDIAEAGAIAWAHERDTPYVPSPLLYDDLLYLLKSNSGILSAFDATSGERIFTERLPVANVYASPVAAAGRVYIAGRDGDTAVLRHGRSLEVLATNQLDDGFDASPAIVGGELYLRGRRFLYRISETR